MVATIFALLLGSPRAFAGPFGLGLAIGSPTGIAAAYEFNDDNNLDVLFGQGWGGWSHERYVLSVDDDIHVFEFTSGADASLDFYVGGGVNLWLRPGLDADFGVEAPLGLSLRFKKQPFELFAEVCPGFVLTEYEWFDVGGSVGGRYYFGG